MREMKKQSGFMLIQATLALILASMLFSAWVRQRTHDIDQETYSLEAKRMAEIVHAVVRYQSSGGDSSSGLLAPTDQHNVSGQPFRNGTTHVGLNWLKETTCSGATSAPFELLPCTKADTPLVGDASQYRFTIANDGTLITTTFSVVNSSNTSQGIVINGNLAPDVAGTLSAKAEPLITFSSSGGVNTNFIPNQATAMPIVDISIDNEHLPYLTPTGSVPVVGDLRFKDGAGIVFEDLADISGVDEIFANRFVDRGNTSKYIDAAGTSKLTNVDLTTINGTTANMTNVNASNKVKGSVLEGTTGNITTVNSTTTNTTDMTATNAKITNAEVQFIKQTSSTLQNQFLGEVRVGSSSQNTTIGKGHIFTTGNIYDQNNNNYMIDLSGTSRVHDLAIGNAKDALLSDRLPNFIHIGVKVVRANDLIPQPSCGTTGTARLILTPQQWTTYFLDQGNININNNLNYLSATVSGSNWRVNIKTHRVSDQAIINDPNGVALAQIYCYYP
ncbi:hypothetical protein [Vibrio agarivorans]|uniref:hypothetical protein n=1 Tax=Vibrio agarivorans TaxID=153622 RepID=UPI0025B4A360|nr:hypothetical protein [Vibrio agarivorans]MDN3661087.1 hypothetical protein [Vibrio agarivorans]